MTKFKLLHLSGLSIFEQLQLEEALLRADSDNWCIINSGASPAIVLGISAKPEEHLDLKLVRQDNIPVIKRFSGGGTVYVDPNTLFVVATHSISRRIVGSPTLHFCGIMMPKR